MFVGGLIVGPERDLQVVFVIDISEENLPARIARLRKPRRNLERRGAELRRIARVVYKWRSERELTAAIAGRGSEGREISGQHRGCGYVCRRACRSLTDRCALVTRKE